MKEQNNLRDKAITVLELTKGFTPEQRKEMGNLLTTMEELAGDVMVQAQDSDELRNKVIELEEGIKKYCHHMHIFFSSPRVGQPPDINDLRKLVKLP